MEIGNLHRKKVIQIKDRNKAKGIRSNACVVCQQKRCRPWKCGKIKNCKAATARHAKYTDDISEVVMPHVTLDNDYSFDSENE